MGVITPDPQGPAGTVQPYKDGVGNIINAIQWDGTSETLGNILAWTKRAHSRAGGSQVVIQNDHLLQGVGINDWLVMDSHRFEQVFPMTNPQFRATYVLTTGSPIP